METKAKKNNRKKTERLDLRFCDPDNFIKYGEMMINCCQDRSDCADKSTMRASMMKAMKEMCCGPATKDTEV